MKAMFSSSYFCSSCYELFKFSPHLKDLQNKLFKQALTKKLRIEMLKNRA